MNVVHNISHNKTGTGNPGLLYIIPEIRINVHKNSRDIVSSCFSIHST